VCKTYQCPLRFPPAQDGQVPSRPLLNTQAVLATICFLACVFYVSVLFQWIRDTKRKPSTSPVVDNEVGGRYAKKGPYIVGPLRAAEKHNRLTVTAHERIAKSLSQCKK
jgi:hypothetical protein